MDLQSAIAAKHFGAKPTLVLEELLLATGLGVEQRHTGQLGFPLLHEDGEGFVGVGCGSDPGQGVGEDDGAGRTLR